MSAFASYNVVGNSKIYKRKGCFGGTGSSDRQDAFPGWRGWGGVWPQACCTEDGFRAWDFILPTMLVDSRREERPIIFAGLSAALQALGTWH